MYKLLAVMLLIMIPAKIIKLTVEAPSSMAPGSKVKVQIYVKNVGGESVVIREFKAKIRSKSILGLPLKLNLGWYVLPMDPITVYPGEVSTINELIEVPYAPLFGEFEAEVYAVGEGQVLGFDVVTFYLEYTLLTLIILAILIVTISSLFLYLYRKLTKLRKRWVKRRSELTLSNFTSS